MDRYDDDLYEDGSYDDGSRYDHSSFNGESYDGDDIAVEPSASDEALDHLWNAAHELLRAVRMIVDAADEFVASQRGATNRRVPPEHTPDREPRVRRIDIDDRVGADDPVDGSAGSPGTPGATPR
jgi:hypothetical protein